MKKQQGEYARKGIYVYPVNDSQDNGYVDFEDSRTGIEFKSFLEEDIDKALEVRRDIKNVRQRKWYRREMKKLLDEEQSETQYFLLLDDGKVRALASLNNKEQLHLVTYLDDKNPEFEFIVNRCMLTVKAIMEMTGAGDGLVVLTKATFA